MGGYKKIHTFTIGESTKLSNMTKNAFLMLNVIENVGKVTHYDSSFFVRKKRNIPFL